MEDYDIFTTDFSGLDTFRVNETRCFSSRSFNISRYKHQPSYSVSSGKHNQRPMH